jgi:hypothetical protein
VDFFIFLHLSIMGHHIRTVLILLGFVFAAANANGMQIFAKTLTGKTIALEA